MGLNAQATCVNDNILRRVGSAAASGTLATGAMSAFMAVAERAGWLGRLPPKKMTDRLLRSIGRSTRPATSWPLTALNHALFGAVAGIPMGFLATRLRTTAGRAGAGCLYGAALWAVMYAGVLPSLAQMRRPRFDRPGRPASMAIAHVIYGGALGLLAGWERRVGPTLPKVNNPQ